MTRIQRQLLSTLALSLFANKYIPDYWIDFSAWILIGIALLWPEKR